MRVGGNNGGGYRGCNWFHDCSWFCGLLVVDYGSGSSSWVVALTQELCYLLRMDMGVGLAMIFAWFNSWVL